MLEIVPDPISLVELGAILLSAARWVRDKVSAPVDVEAGGLLIETALKAAIDEVALDPTAKEALFERIVHLLASSQDLSWLISIAEDVPQESIESLAGWPAASALLIRFRELLQEGLRDEAARPESPLFNAWTVAHLTALAEDVRALSRSAPASLTTSAPVDLPGPVRRLIGQLLDRAVADALERELLRLEARREDEWMEVLRHPPSWLSDAPWEAWAAIGEHAGAHQRLRAAATAFSQCAVRDAPRAATWYGRSALHWHAAGDLVHAEAMLADARHVESRSADEDRYLDVAEAILHQTSDRDAVGSTAEGALREGTVERTSVTVVRAQYLAAHENFDEAISLLRSLGSDSDRGAGVLLVLAEVLLSRSDAEQGRNRHRDALEARTIALQARDLRRRWRGPSSKCVAIACQAAALEGDWDLITTIGTAAGEASPEEAADPDVRRIVDLAGGQSGPAHDPATQAFRDGLTALMARDEQRAREFLLEAASTTSHLGELAAVLRALAELGHEPLPRLAEIAASDPDHADTLAAMAGLHAGRRNEAVPALRILARRHRLAAKVLTTHLAKTDAAAAASVAFDAGERMAEARLFLDAAPLYVAAGDLDGARRSIEAGIALAPLGSPVRRDLRRADLGIAWESRDPVAMEVAARAAITEGDRHTDVRWSLVRALFGRRRTRDAWQELTAEPRLSPDSEQRAILLLHIQARAAPTALEVAADVCDQFGGSEEVMATALSLFVMSDYDDDLEGHPALARMRAHLERFTSTDDGPFHRISFSEPDELIAEIRGQITRPDHVERARRQLAEQVSAGAVPFGFALEVTGRLYVPALLAVDSIGFPCVPAERASLLRQIEDARRALDGAEIVIDPSVLCVCSFLPTLWDRMLGQFQRASLPETVHGQVDDLVFMKPDAGSFHVDQATGRLRIISHSDEEVDRLRARRTWIREQAAQLDWVDDAGPPDDLSELEATEVWALGMFSAIARGVPLWCDDLATATMAQVHGPGGFGTYALLVALGEKAVISEDDFREAVHALYSARCADLPYSPGAVVNLAAATGWDMGAAMHPLTRAAFWLDLGAALDATSTLAERLVARGRESVAANVAYAAAVGLFRRLPSRVAPFSIGGVVAGMTLNLDLDAEQVAEALGNARHACATYELADPLPGFVESMQAMLDDEAPEEVASLISSRCSALSSDDRQVVTRMLLQLETKREDARTVLRREVPLDDNGAEGGRG